MRDYQPKTSYSLHRRLYNKTLALIRDYDRLKTEYEDRIEEGIGLSNETPGGKTNRTGDPTGIKAIKLSVIAEQVRAVDKAKLIIPYEYMDGIWNNICHDTRRPDYISESTFKRWKARFIYEVAKNMYWI